MDTYSVTNERFNIISDACSLSSQKLLRINHFNRLISISIVIILFTHGGDYLSGHCKELQEAIKTTSEIN